MMSDAQLVPLTTITQSSITNLLRGASLLACGGGLDRPQQLQLVRQEPIASALKKGIVVLPPDELDNDAVCVTISEVGAASAPVMDKAQVPAALALLEQALGVKITALIPGEIGQEAITLQAAAVTGLPIVDSDLSGCRAVPRLTDLALVVQGIDFQFSPLVLLQRDGALVFVKKQVSLAADEAFVRRKVPKGDICTLVGGCVSAKLIKNQLNYRSYSRAAAIGQALAHDHPLPPSLPTPVVVPPTPVVVQEVQEVERHGFNAKQVLLTTLDKKPQNKKAIDAPNSSRQQLVLTVENEYMQLETKRGKYAFPDLIMLYDAQAGIGIHSSSLKKGMKVTLLVAKAFAFWQNKKAVERGV